eukprot:SAG22_NODE_5691_length_970_cov_4.978186_1_plen_173_part_00
MRCTLTLASVALFARCQARHRGNKARADILNDPSKLCKDKITNLHQLAQAENKTVGEMLELSDSALRQLCVDRRVNVTARRQIRKNAKVLRGTYDPSAVNLTDGTGLGIDLKSKGGLGRMVAGVQDDPLRHEKETAAQEGLREAQEALARGDWPFAWPARKPPRPPPPPPPI